MEQNLIKTFGEEDEQIKKLKEKFQHKFPLYQKCLEIKKQERSYRDRITDQTSKLDPQKLPKKSRQQFEKLLVPYTSLRENTEQPFAMDIASNFERDTNSTIDSICYDLVYLITNTIDLYSTAITGKSSFDKLCEIIIQSKGLDSRPDDLSNLVVGQIQIYAALIRQLFEEAIIVSTDEEINAADITPVGCTSLGFNLEHFKSKRQQPLLKGTISKETLVKLKNTAETIKKYADRIKHEEKIQNTKNIFSISDQRIAEVLIKNKLFIIIPEKIAPKKAAKEIAAAIRKKPPLKIMETIKQYGGVSITLDNAEGIKQDFYYSHLKPIASKSMPLGKDRVNLSQKHITASFFTKIFSWQFSSVLIYINRINKALANKDPAKIKYGIIQKNLTYLGLTSDQANVTIEKLKLTLEAEKKEREKLEEKERNEREQQEKDRAKLEKELKEKEQQEKNKATLEKEEQKEKHVFPLPPEPPIENANEILPPPLLSAIRPATPPPPSEPHLPLPPPPASVQTAIQHPISTASNTLPPRPPIPPKPRKPDQIQPLPPPPTSEPPSPPPPPPLTSKPPLPPPLPPPNEPSSRPIPTAPPPSGSKISFLPRGTQSDKDQNQTFQGALVAKQRARQQRVKLGQLKVTKTPKTTIPQSPTAPFVRLKHIDTHLPTSSDKNLPPQSEDDKKREAQQKELKDRFARLNLGKN